MLAIKEKDIMIILDLVKKNYPLIIKTDTVWGILSTNQQVLFDIKKRPMNKPFVRLVSNFESMHDLKDIHIRFLERFWPGAVTVIKNGISYRMPNNSLLLKIINSFPNRLFYCTSANIHGGDIIQDIVDAKHVFYEWGDNLAFIIPSKSKTFIKSTPSLIIDIDTWKILRSGELERDVNLWIYNNVVVPFKEINKRTQKTTAIEDVNLNDNYTWSFPTKNLYLVPEKPTKNWNEFLDFGMLNKLNKNQKKPLFSVFKKK